MDVFDRRAKLAQKARASRRPDSASFDYLRAEIAKRLLERLAVIKKQFPVAVDVVRGERDEMR